MTSRIQRLITWLALVGVIAVAGCRTPSSGHAVTEQGTTPLGPPLRIMTFNLRLDLASDGPNAWPYRRDWVASLIRFHAPDAIGVQEALAHMLRATQAGLVIPLPRPRR